MEVTGQLGYFKSSKYSKTKEMEGQREQTTRSRNHSTVLNKYTWINAFYSLTADDQAL